MTIAEVSRKYQLSADTLRYYERVGLIPTVNRNKNGIRNYTEEDCKNVEFVKCMRGAGLPIEILIEYVTLLGQGDVTIEARKDILIEQRKELVKKMKEIKDTIERLDYKIDRYENFAKKEKELKMNKEN
ncbi:MAG: MerR family transcriptional regulator [Clostridium perfringens]|nr:MerR family transcriptional regulator [Clostridium perfringens]